MKGLGDVLLQYGAGVFFVVQFVKTMLLTAQVTLRPQTKILCVASLAFAAAWQNNTVPVSIAVATAVIGAVAVVIHQGYRLLRVLGDLFRQRVILMSRGR